MADPKVSDPTVPTNTILMQAPAGFAGNMISGSSMPSGTSYTLDIEDRFYAKADDVNVLKIKGFSIVAGAAPGVAPKPEVNQATVAAKKPQPTTGLD